MTQFDDQLRELRQQMERYDQLEAMLTELRRQRSTLSDKAYELEKAMKAEQQDVDRLEGRSLAAFFYNVVGKMDEKLDKERQEAYAARVKYDAAARELAAVEAELERHSGEQAALRGCGRRYEQVLLEKRAAVRASGGERAAQILELEEQIAALEGQKKELREAASAGRTALGTAMQVLSSLDKAEGWGAWDIMGGGLIADMAKHSSLDDAQAAIERLQSQLRSFKTELADVTVRADIQVNVEGFLHFADYFFDGLFADWAVLDHINQSQEEVRKVKNQIETVLKKLDAMTDSAENQICSQTEKLDRLVLEA